MFNESILNETYEKIKKRRKERYGHISIIDVVRRRFNRTFISYAFLIGVLIGTGFYKYNKFENKVQKNIENKIGKYVTKEEVKTTKNFVVEKTPSNGKKLIEEIKEINSKIKYVLYIDKYLNKTKLIDFDLEKTIYDFSSTDGKGGPGIKQRLGDFKTPEGVYSIKDLAYLGNDSKKLYGVASIKLDYPNKIDIKLNRTGRGILVCGTSLESRINAIKRGFDCTNGSVVLMNNDIKKIYEKIKDYENESIVLIEDSRRPIDIQNYGSELRWTN